MSLINKMLQDLDRRHAMAGADQAVPPRHVRAVDDARPAHEGFRRSLAVLMLAALAWMGWIVFQLQSRPIATDLAHHAADGARLREPAIAPAPVATAPAPPAETAIPAEPAATFKLARSIETPIGERAPKPASKANDSADAPKALPVALESPIKFPATADFVEAKRTSVSIALDVPPARVLPVPVGAAPKVEKRDRVRTPAERAEAEYRRAVILLNQGRAPEAEEGFTAALTQDPAHEAARQALVALLFEQRNLDGARQMLQEGLAINPAQPTFAVGLARILVERRDLPGALGILDGAAGAAASNADFHAMRGTVLQRLVRHREAVDAYRNALRIQSSSPQAWIGLGISLEALAQKAEAADAFRRSLAAGPLGADLRSFAEQRVRALQ